MQHISEFLTHTYVRSTTALSTGRHRLARQRRGVTFIEYAILAAIAVAVGVFLYPFMVDLFKNIFGKVNNVTNNGSAN